MFYIYILKSLKDNKTYVGYTNDLNRRLSEHNSGLNVSTCSKGPYDVVHVECHASRLDAIHREKYLKTGKGREELIKMGL